MLARLFRRFLPPAPPRPPAGNRLRVEALEDRLTPNNRFVVPLPVQADNVTTFHSLGAALSTAGLAPGNVVQVEPFSTPGAISNAAIDAINAGNVTVRGAAEFSPSELPVIHTADAISVDPQEVGLTFQNVNLQLDHALTFNTNAAIRGSYVAISPAGIEFVGTTAAVLQSNTLVNTGPSGVAAVIGFSPVTGSSNLIDGNTILNSTLSYSLFTGGVNGAISDVVSNNTFVGSDAQETSSTQLLRVSEVNGLTIRKNAFRDATAEYGAVYLDGADNVQVLDNVFDMTYDATPGEAALTIASSTGNGASATVRGNTFSTGANGRAVDLNLSTAAFPMSVKFEANNFLATPLGVRITAGATAVLSGIDLGGGPLGSLGANNFRAFRTAASTTVGAIVVDAGANNIGGQTVNAQGNLFAVADPETVVRDAGDDGTEANVATTNSLTGNAAFVQSLYTRFLHRAGDVLNPNGAGQWVTALNGGMTQAAVANAIVRSPEALGYVVDDLYRTILGRDADPAGRSHHVNLMANGWTVETVQIGLLGGAEYRTRFPGDAAFVASLYESVLRRSPQGGVAAWVDLLPSLTRSGVAAGFVLSTEYRTTQVTNLFYDLLKRTPAAAPTPQQVAAWVNTGLDLLSLRVAFAGSAEFFVIG
jgi:hypothetical protein